MLKLIKILMILRMIALIIVMPPLLHQVCLADYTNPSVGDETNAAYWLDRGGLYETYGNFSAAVKAYKKALDLDPYDSSAYFNLSLAYCEMGLYEDSLEAIDQAISRQPQNGKYYYGQAWILLKAGKVEQAQALFQHAADLEDADAIAYLRSQH